ncbi:hypothetical protein AAFF_G00076600, partial [Aldrovandia affinis]
MERPGHEGRRLCSIQRRSVGGASGAGAPGAKFRGAQNSRRRQKNTVRAAVPKLFLHHGPVSCTGRKIPRS